MDVFSIQFVAYNLMVMIKATIRLDGCPTN